MQNLWALNRRDGRRVSLPQNTACDSAARFLKSLIFSGELGPGDRLSPERDLAAYLGISRITLRLGLKSLESTGYIVTTRGAQGGSRVSDVTGLMRCWQDWMHQHTRELEDLCEFRRVVETRIAWLAATRRTRADLRDLEAASEQVGRTGPLLVRWHSEFHNALARAAHSARLEQAVSELRGEIFLPPAQAIQERRLGEIHDLHEAILAAVRDQDAARAADQMMAHLEYTETIFFDKIVARKAYGRRHGEVDGCLRAGF